jgi:hypothetical protein
MLACLAAAGIGRARRIPMGHDDRREIFERLEALERLVRSHSGEHGGRDEHRRGDRHDHGRRDRRDDRDRDDRGRGRREHGRDDRHRGRGDDGFQEKRIIDTIVQLVGERLERFMQDEQAKNRRHDDGDREQRMIDHVVRRVGEHVRGIVQEVVSTELNRRVSPPRDERPGHPPRDAEPEPE